MVAKELERGCVDEGLLPGALTRFCLGMQHPEIQRMLDDGLVDLDGVAAMAVIAEAQEAGRFSPSLASRSRQIGSRMIGLLGLRHGN